jgi:HAD superfamily hydrolase (TIGR01509 family)
MRSASDFDAVTVDAMGTIVELVDPTEALGRALAERGVTAGEEKVRAAFAAEVAYYVQHAQEGRDEEALRELGRACAAVFLDHVGAELDVAEFAPAFVAALQFRPLDGAVEALERLRAAGLVLACVSNWDVSLEDRLAEADLGHLFATVATSAEAGALKPDPGAFLLALERLGVEPGRAVHVGDDTADEDGAAAAGIAFEPVPLATLPERLGLPPST